MQTTHPARKLTARQTSQRELGRTPSRRGETFRITRHGVAVAELRPLPKDGFTPVAALEQALAGLPADDYETLRAEADAVFGDDRIDG